MMQRALMTTDELKSMPRGQFIVMKTGVHPMRCRLPLFFKWGISFEEPYILPEREMQPPVYADRESLEMAIWNKYPWAWEEPAEEDIPQALVRKDRPKKDVRLDGRNMGGV